MPKYANTWEACHSIGVCGEPLTRHMRRKKRKKGAPVNPRWQKRPREKQQCGLGSKVIVGGVLAELLSGALASKYLESD